MKPATNYTKHLLCEERCWEMAKVCAIPSVFIGVNPRPKCFL
jgi:hypothetical protein